MFPITRELILAKDFGLHRAFTGFVSLNSPCPQAMLVEIGQRSSFSLPTFQRRSRALTALSHDPGALVIKDFAARVPGSASPPPPHAGAVTELSCRRSPEVPTRPRQCVGQRETGLARSYVTRVRQRLRRSACWRQAAAVQSCYGCGASVGSQ